MLNPDLVHAAQQVRHPVVSILSGVGRARDPGPFVGDFDRDIRHAGTRSIGYVALNDAGDLSRSLRSKCQKRGQEECFESRRFEHSRFI